ncbi:MAG: helix-turn-helix domain-containing protein [Thermodesulfobacteriota bacterium]
MEMLLTANQVSKMLNCKLATVYAWASSGKIPAYKLNGLLRFKRSEIERWIQESSMEKKTSPPIRSRRMADREINRLVSDAIASVKGSRYTSTTKGKPDQSGPGRRKNGTV